MASGGETEEDGARTDTSGTDERRNPGIYSALTIVAARLVHET